MTNPSVPDDPGRELRQLVETGRYREALEAYRREGDSAVRGGPETTLLAATAATRVGELATAVTLAETALQQFRSRADGDGRMRAMNLLGAIAFEHGRLQEADRCFGEALELARSLEDTRMAAHASNNLASVAHLQNRPEEALSLYRAALLAYQRLGDRRGTSQTYHNLGLVFRQQRDWDDADAAALEAVRHAEEVGDGALLALAVAGRAEFHIDRGDFELARGEVGRAERHATRARDDVGMVETRRLAALLALQTSQLESAAELAQGAREAAARLGVLQLQAECAVIAARALARLDRPAEAAACRTEAIRIFERLGAERLRDDLLREPPV